ncbi:uncharacterized protein F4812DRAFT_419834 [Daldinia caldariorum]|uniref:uncharacterized protein n=1 Tax=Daldinia caldariorum TaxID=326644 RepID=UPI00200817FD|nr:uncharacterized protein F4812DRAFT_419834 [Daldinia caldariorum]KAI1469653.1 hypothetical protein F4812DRAFT_419834 [Daldinia caldariorum]
MKRIRFLGDPSDGSGSKRKQVKKACELCRKGKRKCSHCVGDETPAQQEGGAKHPVTTAVSDLLDAQFSALGEQPSESLESREIDNANQQALSSRPTRALTIPFAGPSSAHSLLSAYANLGIEMDPARQLPGSRILRPSFQDMRAPPSERRPGVAVGYLPMVVRAVLPYLEIECLQVLPPKSDLDAIIEIYRQEIHPILPIVDFNAPVLVNPVSRDNPAAIVFRQAICLVVSKSPSARQYLNLPESDDGQFTLKTPREFADRLFGVLKIAQDIGLVDDRLELVQILALMTFHSYGPDGDDEVARLCGLAVHFAYSAGLNHSSRPSDHFLEPRRVEVLCSLFSLDKIVAMVTGRPTMIHMNKIYLPPKDGVVMETLPPGLALLFRLCQMLDRVLELYQARPPDEMAREDCVWDASWPEFEELVEDCKAQTLHPCTQASLELLYNVIGVISYRPPQIKVGKASGTKSTSSTEIQSSKIRHKYCAQRILSLLDQDVSRLPFIPYAASLSLTVALRNLKQTSLETTKKVARDDVERSLRALDELAATYWHAEQASGVGRQLLQTYDADIS